VAEPGIIANMREEIKNQEAAATEMVALMMDACGAAA
jgi:hypothetical protein